MLLQMQCTLYRERIEMTEYSTMRDIVGLGHKAANLSEAALILIDCQNTYRQGIMQLTGVEDAIKEARRLLTAARELKTPIFHIQHDSGPGSLYDIRAAIGAISAEVEPISGEIVITKKYPNSFIKTDLEDQLKALGIQKVILAGFMTHMCINSTAQGAFNLGFAPTVVANATASRPLTSVAREVLPAHTVHLAALATIRDLFGVVVETTDQVAQ